MAEPAPAAPAAELAAPPVETPVVPNIVADAQTPPAAPAAPAPAAPVLAVATVDPAVARAYLTEHGVSADEVAKIPEADLAKRYEDAKVAEAAKPIVYKDFSLPKDVKLDAAKLSDITKQFATDKLSQDQAQKYIDLHVAAVQESVKANIKAFNDMQTEWVSKIKADPQIGGANFDSKTVPAIAKAIDTFCTDDASRKEFREAVSLTGIGNHPAYVKFMARIGAAVSEGQPLSGNPVKAGPKTFDSMAEKMYGQSKTT